MAENKRAAAVAWTANCALQYLTRCRPWAVVTATDLITHAKSHHNIHRYMTPLPVRVRPALMHCHFRSSALEHLNMFNLYMIFDVIRCLHGEHMKYLAPIYWRPAIKSYIQLAICYWHVTVTFCLFKRSLCPINIITTHSNRDVKWCWVLLICWYFFFFFCLLLSVPNYMAKVFVMTVYFLLHCFSCVYK